MLMEKLNTEKLLLPEFQRDFTWNVERSVDLFDSIARGIFIGALIESKPKFALSCRELDKRPRKGKGSRSKLKEYPFKVKDFQNSDIYVLLDGQQRVTSLYRALHGNDDVYFVLKTPEELPNSESDPTDIMDIVEGFSFRDIEGRVCFSVKEIYDNPTAKEKILKQRVFEEVWERFKPLASFKEYENDYFDALLNIRHLFNKILDDKTLLSVFLLDMDLEKFCLFFERSNSKGVSLNFIDILTAKIYVGFNLRKNVDGLRDSANIPIDKNTIEAIVRYISYLEEGKVDKKTILSSLDANHFNNHWTTSGKLFDKVYSYLLSENWLVNYSWLNYKNMLIPMVHFLRNLPHEDFSQMTQDQCDFFKYWFYSSLINTRYGGGMAGSSNDVIVDDCNLLEKLAKEGSLNKNDLSKFRIKIDKDDLLNLTNRGAFFNGLMSLLNFDGKFKNWSNTSHVNTGDKIDVHHIYPKKFIRDKYGEESEQSEYVDTILNKTVIEKLPNQKFGSKAPSQYLNESPIIDNKELKKCLSTHFIPMHDDLIQGKLDDKFKNFLDERFKLIDQCLKRQLVDFQDEILN